MIANSNEGREMANELKTQNKTKKIKLNKKDIRK